MSATCYIALGSNLGDRRGHLDRAVELLRRTPGVTVARVSRSWETAPVGGPPGQGPFLNAVAELQTSLTARELLAHLLGIEQQLGRVRTEHWGPRTIDLDLLFYDDTVIREPDLSVPHERLHRRAFVLGPLAELAPGLVHPVLGRTVVELLADLATLHGRDVEGMRAVVTGSSGGIGRAIALALAARGADVVVHARRSLERAEQVAAEARGAGVRAEVVLADLRTPDGCAALAERVSRLWGDTDIWVNNAGADTLTGPAAHWTFEQKLVELLAVDLNATVRLSRHVGQRMKSRGRGVILNMGWDQAEPGMEGDSGQLFAAAKGAVMAFTKSLALTLAPEVRVNCLAPGWIRTAWGETASAAWQERAVREAALRRWGTPEDVAAAACWLASPAAGFITGQVIRVNGGAVR
jgi:2-amino-4-hydroxy-6-hydroxymethyldihydropteridine diphosphokinase